MANFGLPGKLERLLPFVAAALALSIVLAVNFQSLFVDGGGIMAFMSSEGCAMTALCGYLGLYILIVFAVVPSLSLATVLAASKAGRVKRIFCL